MRLKVVNNVIHDVSGAGLGVWGVYDVLMAYNTLVRVGGAAGCLPVANWLARFAGWDGTAGWLGQCMPAPWGHLAIKAAL
jgi:hypothetical protein